MHLLFDIGASKTRLAVTDDLDSFGEPLIIETPKNFEDAIGFITRAGMELVSVNRLDSVCGGIAGVLDQSKNRLLRSNLPKWIGKPLKERLSDSFERPVYLENDSALVGLGEAVFGAGKDYSIVAYITVSTGVGGVRIVNGAIDKSIAGFEPGHQIIASQISCGSCDGTEFSGPVCPNCGGISHLESYISGTAFEKKYGKKPYEIFDEKIWDEAARVLAVGLNNIVVLWSPDVLVVGGSMMKKIGIPIEKTREYLKDYLKIFSEPPLLMKAELEDFGGLYGAMAYLRNLRDGK
jgi:predicted NBD/HSP70 family sugar kinase